MIKDFDLDKILNVPTKASDSDRANDEWDNDNCCNYSNDGTKLLDSEDFTNNVIVRDGTRIICDEVFAFDSYMDEDRPLGSEIPQEERASFLDKIKLPSTITHIGKEAFRECGYLKSIRLPVSLQVIGEAAFKDCWELESIACPSSLLSIGNFAFQNCFSMYNLRLNKGLRIIGDMAFNACESLEEVQIPERLESMGVNPFILSSVRKITSLSPDFPVKGKMLFHGNELICYFGHEKEVTIPDGTTAIWNYAFCCKKMPKVNIPDSVENVGEQAFMAW